MAKRQRRSTIIERSQEALSRPINPTGAGEDAVVKDLLGGKMAQATDQEALGMALALRNIIRGQETILKNQELQDEQIAKLREEAAIRDDAARKFNENQEKFLQDVADRAMSMIVKGGALDSLKADAAQQTQRAYQEAMAKVRADAMEFAAELERMPKETVVSGGKLIIVQENGQQTTRVEPEEIRIKSRRWLLQPGVPTVVPKIVADVLRERRMGEKTTREIERVLQSDLEVGEVNRRMANIRKREEAQYDPDRAPLPENAL